ncbi:NADH-quinone oxidoreductase subunit N [bacterium]|nr:MAG: NADH-quinone oxidoreductase subunit N [bacterium]
MALGHEIYLAVVALVAFLASIACDKGCSPRKAMLVLSFGAVISSLLALGSHGELFEGTYRIDIFSQSFKVLISVGFFLAVALGGKLKGVEEEYSAEYYLFLTISVLGLTFMVSAMDLLTLYIALEVSSYSLYILVPLRKDNQNHTQVESAIKYVLFGAVASGVSLFGMSYLYGLAHTTSLATLYKVYPAIATEPMGLIALAMLFGSFFFKLALFPFHLWTPDVYQGASNETTAIVATLPKVGAVAVMIRLIAIGGGTEQFTFLLVVLAAFSMFYGNLAALAQTDLKRLLAFSSISHAGYMMAGILSNSVSGQAAATYYVSGYLIMNLALFFVINSLSKEGGNVTLEDLRGLHKRSPLLAFTLAAGAFGLAGIPPMAGFAGKLFVLTSAFEAKQMWLVIIGALNTAIAIYYYLKMVRAAYTPDPEAEEGEAVEISLGAKALGVLFIAAILTVGIIPGFFIEFFKHGL